MILTKRFVIIFINTMIGYQLGNLVLIKRCTTDGNNYTQPMATKRKLFFIAILRTSFWTELKVSNITYLAESTPKYAKRQEIIYETWLKNFSTHLGDVKFVRSNTLNESDILTLNGVEDNVYPPQRKSFQLLFYMYSKLLSKYDFFLRIVTVYNFRKHKWFYFSKPC